MLFSLEQRQLLEVVFFIYKKQTTKTKTKILSVCRGSRQQSGADVLFPSSLLQRSWRRLKVSWGCNESSQHGASSARFGRTSGRRLFYFWVPLTAHQPQSALSGSSRRFTSSVMDECETRGVCLASERETIIRLWWFRLKVCGQAQTHLKRVMFRWWPVSVQKEKLETFVRVKN